MLIIFKIIMKYATIALAVLASTVAAETEIKANIGNNTIEGSTKKNGNVTEGNWKVHGENGKHNYSQEVNYIVNKNGEDKHDKQYIKRTTKKFDNYFLYAIESKNLEIGSEQGQCKIDADCGDSGYVTKCCSQAILKDAKTGKQHENFRCMTRSVVNANMDLKINNMTVTMRCSNAVQMGVTFAASAATLAALTLY